MPLDPAGEWGRGDRRARNGCCGHGTAQCSSREHPARHRHPHAQSQALGSRATPSAPRAGHRLAHLVLLEASQVANHPHAGAGVERLFDRFGEGDVDDDQLRNLEAVFIVDLLLHGSAENFRELAIAGGEVECRDVRLAQQFRQGAGDHRPQQFGDRIGVERLIGPDQFLEQGSRVGRAERVGPEGPDADRAKLRIAQHHGVGSAPLEVGQLPGADEIHLGTERAVEPIFPACEGRQQGQILALELVAAGLEDVGDLAAIDKDRLLSGADNQLGAVLDLVLVAGKPPDQRVLRIVDPLDDVDEFIPQLVEQSHG